MTAKQFLKLKKGYWSDSVGIMPLPEVTELMQSYADHCEEAKWIDISLYGFPPVNPTEPFSEPVLVTDGVDYEVARYGYRKGAWVMLHYCNTPTHWRKLSFSKKDKHEIK